MLSYYKPVILPDQSVLSCDNLVLNCSLNLHYKNEFELYLNRPDLIHIDSYESLKSFKYRYFYQFNYSDSSMRLKYQFNGSNHADDIIKVELDFNPNKVCSERQFWADFGIILSCMESVSLSRCDIALDVPAARENVFIRKSDKRIYTPGPIKSIEDRTEYLGRHNTCGFVKVYNKKIESKLDHDLTRIEVTCDSVDDYLQHFPEVYCLENGCQFSFDDLLSLDDTDLYILRAEMLLMANHLDEGLVIFNSLSRRKKQKLKAFICPESAGFNTPAADSISRVFFMIKQDFLK